MSCDELRDAVSLDLMDLNDLARATLGPKPWRPSRAWAAGPDDVPTPSDLPPVGSWIVAVRRVATSADAPVGKVHQFIGWSPRNGNLGVGCNRWRPGRAIATAYEGERSLRLDVLAEPPAGACEKCLERSREIRA
jgi:hypothetical protein